MPNARASRSPSGTSSQPRFGAIDTSPSRRRTTPTIATPTPIIGSQVRMPSAHGAGARSARSAAISSTEVWPRGPVDARACRRPRRRARRAPRRASRPRSRGRGRRRAGAIEAARPGTAGRACPAAPAAPRIRCPASASSPTRPRIALRVRPVRGHELGARQRTAVVELADDGAAGSRGGPSHCAARRRPRHRNVHRPPVT